MSTASTGEPLLTVEDLRTWFQLDGQTVRAVDGISFAVDQGETVGLVGESGCGKTVTSLSILDLLPHPPAEIRPGSSIRFRERELVGMDEAEMRVLRGSEIAMIFQEPMSSLNPVYTIGNQIIEVIRLHGSGADPRGEAIRLLGEVGISDPERRIDEYPHQLSGGMRQRVMIAMALAGEPSLLIADEPTTALDVTIQAQILDLLARLGRARNMAMLLITHDLGIVAEVCDRVIVMYAGQVVEEGSVFDVFENPQHPYTQGLLGALPGPERERGELRSIPGTVPSPASWPTGCRFEARCPVAEEACRQEQVEKIEGRRRALCWRAFG